MDLERLANYNEDHCWQYDIRLKNLSTDLKEVNLTEAVTQKLRVTDFEYRNITDMAEKRNLTEFIKRHEWLGNLSQFTTHWFGCYYNNILAGVILFNVPNAFSKLLGDDTKEVERLISRGACISWSPKNLASSFLMWCIKWMVKNTQYRLFTAYSDPTAKELGTIYQACNFHYLGQKSGTSKRYLNPYTGAMVSDRFFRQKTTYKKYAEELGIPWQKNWNHRTGMSWNNMPEDVEATLRQYGRDKQKSCEPILFPNKHKYAYILGSDKRETKKLTKILTTRNLMFDYPKER